MPSEQYIVDTIQEFRKLKRFAEGALRQVNDENFFIAIDSETNSLAVLVKHLSGNMSSRWRDFLTSDGEKPDRDRDAEFEIQQEDTRDRLEQGWESGWRVLIGSLETLSVEDLKKTVTIRGEPHRVTQAINRQLTHCGVHIGQMILLSKHFSGSEWQTLSIPKGRSSQYNQKPKPYLG